ncbi:MAG: hypothetical protein P8Y20_12505 [Gammaproteobacteria bacterium]|jgi:hypothetical protein
MAELRFEHGTSINNADFDSFEDNITLIGEVKDANPINFDTRRKIENMLEEKALRKLLEDTYDF